MTDYFISYARKDGADFADKLHDDLEADGYDAWIDKRDILGSDYWDDAIEDALKNCEALLLVITPGSTESQNVKDEWGYVLNKKPIIPLMVETADIPFRANRIQYIDFRDNYDSGIAKLRKLLKDLKKKT
ncbi:MAG: toll/interleukin-1 receptor domain-containing protein [Chloroflexota bacterium]